MGAKLSDTSVPPVGHNLQTGPQFLSIVRSSLSLARTHCRAFARSLRSACAPPPPHSFAHSCIWRLAYRVIYSRYPPPSFPFRSRARALSLSRFRTPFSTMSDDDESSSPPSSPSMTLDDDDDDASTTTTTTTMTTSTTVLSQSMAALHRKKRHFTTPDQKHVLEYVYQLNTRPNKRLQTWLATRLMMSSRRVRVWFQNKRTRDKGRNMLPTHQQSPMDDEIIHMITTNNYLKTTTSSTATSSRGGTSTVSTVSVTEERVYPRTQHYFTTATPTPGVPVGAPSPFVRCLCVCVALWRGVRLSLVHTLCSLLPALSISLFLPPSPARTHARSHALHPHNPSRHPAACRHGEVHEGP